MATLQEQIDDLKARSSGQPAQAQAAEDADSEDSDDILSYLQGLHDSPEACIFDIAVHNFLYNAGAEFESLQW